MSTANGIGAFAVRRVGFIDADGNAAGALPEHAGDPAALRGLYEAMALTRAFDAKAVTLQRTGRLGTFASSLGQEAVAVGVAAAMRAEDVLVPSFREQGAQLLRGVRPLELLLYWGGDERGSDFRDAREDFPVCVPVGSHAPHAAGVAMAFKLRGEARVAVCVFGDGATSKGDVYEAMNFAGVERLPVVFVVNDNQWAISVPRARQSAAPTLAHKAAAVGFDGVQVDGNDVLAVRHTVGEAVERARDGGGPTLVEALTYRLADHTTADDASRYRDDAEVSRQWHADPVARLRRHLTARDEWDDAREHALERRCGDAMEAAAADYLATPPQPPGSMFQHLYARLPEALRAQAAHCAARAAGSAGDGDAPDAGQAEADDAADAARDREHAHERRAAVPPARAAARELTLVDAVRTALARALEEDDRVLVFGEDVARDGGVFRATDGLHARFGDARVFDTPLSEALFAGLAVGLAAQGLRPVAEFQFMGFLYPAIDQLANHASRLRNRTRGRLTCPLVVRAPYGGGIHAPEHHSESFEAMLAHVPGLRVVIPSSPRRAYGLLLAAIRDPDPVVFLEPKRLYRASREAVTDDGDAAPLDRCFVVREGSDLTLVAWGACVADALAAADTLAAEGVQAEVLDVATLKPFDEETVLASVARTGRCVIVHEAPLTAGFGAEIAARLADRGLTALLAPVKRVAGYDTVMPLPRLESFYLPGEAQVLAAARDVLEYR